jgi:hypothetical protein
LSFFLPFGGLDFDYGLRIGFVQCSLEVVNLACVIAGFCTMQFLRLFLFNCWISSFGCPIGLQVDCIQLRHPKVRFWELENCCIHLIFNLIFGVFFFVNDILYMRGQLYLGGFKRSKT